MDSPWRNIDNSQKCLHEVQVANIRHWKKVYCGRHLWWMHSWAWPDEEIWPVRGSKEWTIKISTWWHTITENGNNCTLTSSHLDRSNIRAAETMLRNIVGWTGQMAKEYTARSSRCICTTWQWLGRNQFDSAPDQYWELFANQTVIKVSSSGQMWGKGITDQISEGVKDYRTII